VHPIEEFLIVFSIAKKKCALVLITGRISYGRREGLGVKPEHGSGGGRESKYFGFSEGGNYSKVWERNQSMGQEGKCYCLREKATGLVSQVHGGINRISIQLRCVVSSTGC
jgi:hypothetical protein